MCVFCLFGGKASFPTKQCWHHFCTSDAFGSWRASLCHVGWCSIKTNKRGRKKKEGGRPTPASILVFVKGEHWIDTSMVKMIACWSASLKEILLFFVRKSFFKKENLSVKVHSGILAVNALGNEDSLKSGCSDIPALSVDVPVLVFSQAGFSSELLRPWE